MSKSNIRKITVDPTKCNTDSRRPSVFERLGTKPAVTATGQNTSDYCRNWALNGSCSYGKNCKYANTHTLISPSKRAKKDNAISSTTGLVEDPFKRLTSKIVKKPSHSPDLNLEEWNQTDLEYEDEKVLERRRQLLQRELEIQMKKDKEVHGKEKVRQKKKAMSSSSSSRTSSTSSSSSSSSSEDSSSSSTSDSRKKVKKMKLKRHHSASTDYDEDKERRRKLKIKRLGAKNEKPVTKKKRKIDAGSIKKDITARTSKKCVPSTSRKHSNSARGRSPTVQVSTSVVTSTPPTLLGSSVSVPHHVASNKVRERNRSDSPKQIKGRGESEKDDRHYKKMRDADDVPSKESVKGKSFDKLKEQEKEKNRTIDEKSKVDDRLKAKCKDKDVRSRTPLASSDRSKHQYNKESVSTKSRRSRTPEKPSRSKREVTPSRNQERLSSSSRSRDAEKKDRDNHKVDKSKDREDLRKSEQGKPRQSSNQEETHRKNINKDFDEKSYLNDKTRQKSRECRDKEHARDERNHTRFNRDQRDPQRDKEKDDTQDRCRERQRDRDRERDRERERDRDRDRDRDRERDRERDRDRDRDRERDRERDKESIKPRDRDAVSSLISSASMSLAADKNSRYARDKERVAGKEATFEKATARDRRSDRERERSETKALSERERSSSQRFDARYDRNGADKDALNRKTANSLRDRVDRFPRERSLDKAPLLEKAVHPPATASSAPLLPPVPPCTTSSSSSAVAITPAISASRDHLIDRADSTHYERDRHRRFGTRYERGHGSEHERKESRVTPTKIDRVVERRDASPRRAIEIERSFNRNYGRLGADHWEDQEEANPHLDYRDHHAHEDDRRKIIDGRRYDSPFEERRGVREERSRDSRYVVQTSDRPAFDDHRHHHHHHRHPIYSGDKLRSGGSALRDEAVPNDDWEAHHREVEHSRDRTYPTVDWEEREWRARALWGSRDSLPRSEAHDDEWTARYENSISDWKTNENRKWDNQSVHIRGHYRNERSKEVELGESTSHNKRRPYANSEVREECPVHTSKQTSLYGSMKEEPINKKLMELAEGRLHTNREKSVEVYQKKNTQREKSEVKETHLPEPKRSCIEESLQTLHTESDLSDISDDPDDILNMEEEVTDAESNKLRASKKAPDSTQREQQPVAQETAEPSPKECMEDTVFNAKGKDNTVTMAFRNMDDENMETMDFEEISDGELEEDIKTSGKGLGDALGVDWESFVKEMQPRRPLSSGQHNAENRWECKAIFHRIGISFKYAGEDTVKKLSQKYGKEDHGLFLDNVALVHTALTRNEFLRNLSNNLLPSMDDLVYRHENASNDDPDYDIDALKPCTALYETAKCLLQQAV